MTCNPNSFLALVLFLGSPFATAVEQSSAPNPNTVQSETSIAQSELSEYDRARATLWKLEPTEWQRYRMLMQGIRGSISPVSISPIEVLGIHARDDAERQRYAERWAQVMHEDVDRILAFQHAYDAASKRLYANLPLIDVNKLPAALDTQDDYLISERFLLFTAPDCAKCDDLATKMLRRLDLVRGIDIYLTGQNVNDDAVRAWAATHNIEPEWVRTRRVTLNRDGGALAKLTGGKGQVPMVFRRRGENIEPLDESSL